MPKRTSLVAMMIYGFLPMAALAQDSIQEISFESIPPGTHLFGASITLDGPVEVSGELEAQSGVRFPDGTLQTTAASEAASLHGLYDNRIVMMTPPEPYTEICFKNGGTESDIHDSGESTEGGDCQPGDVGWIIERFEREEGASIPWASARATCLLSGMRLPEPFEWMFVCSIADPLAVIDMTTDAEWASNNTSQVRVNRDSGLDNVYQAAFAIGNGACTTMFSGAIAQTTGGADTYRYRCAR